MFLSHLVKQNVVTNNKNGKHELTDEFPNDVRLKKISKLHSSSQNENIVNTSKKLLQTRY